MSEPVTDAVCDARTRAILNAIGGLNENTHAVRDDVSKLSKLILGNGELGIMGRVINLEESARRVRSGVWQVAVRILPWALTAVIGGMAYLDKK